MKRFLFLILLAGLFYQCSNTPKNDSGEKSSQIVAPTREDIHIIVEQSTPDTLKGSLKAKAMGTIGTTGITLNYYSPAVRERIIWGGLVAFDKVWVTGAHRATSIEFDQEVIIGDKRVDAGKYALFTIPGRESWIVIINRNWDQHLADDYDQNKDVIRVMVNPEILSQPQERLMYTIEQSPGSINMTWGTLRIALPVQSSG